MDIYGFSSALHMALRLFDGALRQTGRTTRLLEQAQLGDLIVTTTGAEADRVMRLLNSMHKRSDHGIRVTACPPRGGDWNRLRGFERVLFTHEWIMEHYRLGLEYLDKDMESISALVNRKTPELNPEPHSMNAWRKASIGD